MVCFFLIPGFPSNAVGEHPRRKKVRTNLGIESPVIMLKTTLLLFAVSQSSSHTRGRDLAQPAGVLG